MNNEYQLVIKTNNLDHALSLGSSYGCHIGVYFSTFLLKRSAK